MFRLSTLPHPLQALPKTSAGRTARLQPGPWSDRKRSQGPKALARPSIQNLCCSHWGSATIFYNIAIFILTFKIGSLKSIKRPSLAPCRGTASRRLDLGGCPGWTLRCSLSPGSRKCRDKCPECMWIWMPSKDMER